MPTIEAPVGLLPSVREVACGLRRDLYLRYGVTVLKAFIDDSGSGGDSPWYVLAGYIGTVDGWDKFDTQWAEVLHATPRIEYFKAREAESLRPDEQWASVLPADRDAKIDALIEVIGKCARRPICARLSQKNYNEIIKGNLPPIWDSPYYILAMLICGAAINIERLDGDCEAVDFVFDEDERHKHRFPLMMEPLKGSMESFHNSLVNVVRRDDKDFPPLQAADLLAWQIRRFLCEPGRRRHYDLAMNCCPKEAHTFIADRSRLRDMMQGMQATAARLSEELGKPRDVRKWK